MVLKKPESICKDGGRVDVHPSTTEYFHRLGRILLRGTGGMGSIKNSIKQVKYLCTYGKYGNSMKLTSATPEYHQ